MGKAGETRDTAVMVATGTISGGFLGLNSTLTVHGDGTLRLSDRRFNTNETRKVSRTQVRPLQAALSRSEWEEVEPFYGQPVFDGFTETIKGGGERTAIVSPSVEPVTIPPILGEVLGRLHDLWPAADPLATDEEVTELLEFPEANLFELEGEGVQITYGILRQRREFLDYRDEQRELTFSGEKGEISSLESGIGRMVTVTLEVIPDSHELTLTLLLPWSCRVALSRAWRYGRDTLAASVVRPWSRDHSRPMTRYRFGEWRAKPIDPLAYYDSWGA